MAESGPLHIVIADDHPLFRDALKLTLQNRLASASIEGAGSLEEATRLIA